MAGGALTVYGGAEMVGPGDIGAGIDYSSTGLYAIGTGYLLYQYPRARRWTRNLIGKD